MNNSTQNTTTTADDEDVILERENSAWDAIGERFQQAAAEGRYLDLSEGEKQLGAADAAEAFAATEQPVDPSTIVQEQVSDESAQDVQPQSPLLTELGSLVNELVTKLKATREKLLKANAYSRKESLRGAITAINKLTRRLQQFVNRNSEAVLHSDVARRRIEQMNLLVCKANALITTYNHNQNGTSRASRAQAREKAKAREETEGSAPTRAKKARNRSAPKDRRGDMPKKAKRETGSTLEDPILLS